MVSDALACRAMADKYRRLAEQQTDSRLRDRYRTFASAYHQMAKRLATGCKHKVALRLE